jgi:sterol desaturase/sphingolipid hydroxylase (fatty acid hydroxylase superfamily)
MVMSAERRQDGRAEAGWVASPEAVDSREAFRQSVRARISPRYSPLFHLATPSVVGLGLIAASLACLRAVRWWELLLVPFVYVLSNAVEHRAHRLALHRRSPGLTVLYDRHTPVHHRIFVARDMAIRDRREFAIVLLPWFGIVAIFAMTAPITAGLWLLERNLACLFVATTMFYVLSYEWLHLSYHLPPTHPVGRLAIVQRLRRHHATHHHPPLMQKWNFNVTVPLWDHVRGTVYPGRIPELSADAVARGTRPAPQAELTAPPREAT